MSTAAATARRVAHTKERLDKLAWWIAQSHTGVSIREMSAYMFLSISQTKIYVQILRDEKRVYVSKYDRLHGTYGAQLMRFKAGNRKDADPLPVLTNAQVQKAKRDRRKKRDPLGCEIAQVKLYARKRKPAPELLAALFK